MNNSSKYSAGAFTPLNLAFIALVFVSYIVFIIGGFTENGNWGINQLSFFPVLIKILWLILASVFSIFLFIEPPRHYFSDWLSPWLWGDRKKIGRIGLIIIAMIVFAVLRYTAHLYDDSYILIGNFAQRTRPVFDPASYGANLIPWVFFKLIALIISDKVTAAMLAYQLVSVLSGGAFIYFSVLLSEILFDDNHRRLSFGFLLLLSGIILYFFGMIANHPLVLPLFALAAYYLVCFIRTSGKKYLLYLWLSCIVGIIIHFQFIVILPGVIFLTAVSLVPRKTPRHFPAFAASIFLIALFTAIYYIRASGNLLLESNTLFISGKSPEIDYGLLDMRHIIDIFNIRFMLVPLTPPFILAIILGLFRLWKDKLYVSLLIMTIAGAVYLFILDPQNGMARDFTSYGFLLTPMIFLGAYAVLKLADTEKVSLNTMMALCPAAFLLILPTVIVHLTPSLTEATLDRFIEHNEYKTESYYYAKRDYYYAKGEPETASRIERAIVAKAPGALESQLVNDLFAQERYQDSYNYAELLVDKYPYDYRYRMQKGLLLKHYKKFAEAENMYLSALELKPSAPEPYHWLTELYREQGLEHKIRPVLKNGLEVDPENSQLLTDLMGHYFRNGNYEESDSVGGIILGIDPDNIYPYMYRGLIAEHYGQYTRAMENYNKFIDTDKELPEIPIIMRRMNDIVLKQRDGLPIN